ncbi:MAG: hypothetical protein JNL25_11535 [Rhodospirillaceae bacterium]|nr:hypothetical protein [Rhodospirillaceae bacterium]
MRSIPGLVVGIVLLGAGTAPAAACPCPKQKMIEMHGTVSMYGPSNSPRLGLAAQQAATKPVSVLPVVLPLVTPASDQVADPLLHKPLFIEQ